MSAQWAYDAPPQQRPTVVYASWGWRALAALVDGLVGFAFLLIPAIVLSVVFVSEGLDEEQQRHVLNLVSVPLVLVFLLTYFPLTMRRAGARNGQTWGKQLCDIRVVRANGAPVDVRTTVLRETLLKYVLFVVISAFVLLIPMALNYLWPLWDPRNQALHDKLASTFVIKGDPIPASPPTPTYASGWEPPVPPGPPGSVQWGP